MNFSLSSVTDMCAMITQLCEHLIATEFYTPLLKRSSLLHVIYCNKMEGANRISCYLISIIKNIFLFYPHEYFAYKYTCVLVGPHVHGGQEVGARFPELE